MNDVLTTKNQSPFYPGQPVPADLFTGRTEQVDHFLMRGAGQVAAGKPIAIFVEGEYGIGKSSLAKYVMRRAELEYGMHGIYCPLGGAKTLEDIAPALLEATIRSGALDPTRSEIIRGWLSKYIGAQKLFGISLDFKALKEDSPNLQSAFGALSFFGECLSRMKKTGVKGLFLILDEINGITRDPAFAHYIKAVVDTNAFGDTPLPLLMVLCGVEERRRDMIKSHQPVDRIFDVIEVGAMSESESTDFFAKAFGSVKIALDADALELMVYYSAGFPKIMHLVGDCAYWTDKDDRIDKQDALRAIILAAEDVGTKYVDQQVYKALRSEDYHSILRRIANGTPETLIFKKKDIETGLKESEKKKLSNFLQKMKRLGVLRSGDVSGEYVFNVRMVWLYMKLRSSEQ